MKRMSKKLLALGLTAVFALGLAACGGSGGGGNADKPIVVSSKAYTESLLLGKMTKMYMEKLGYKVKDETGLDGAALIRNSLTSGEIDTYWEFTGTAYMNFMEQDIAGKDAEDVYKEVKKWDSENNKLAWLDHSDINNTYCFVTREDVAQANNLKTVSDLAKAYNENKDLRFIANPEYFERADGMPALEKAYNFKVPTDKRVLLELGMFYSALENKQGELCVGFTTDGMIGAKKFVVLEDDKNVFPIYYATPVFRQEVLDAHPELEKQMNELSAKLDTETMAKLNASVDIDKKSVDEVAETFLKDNGLL